MGSLVISEFISLDGVVEDPPRWAGRVGDGGEVDAIKLEEALRSEALLLGRRSYEFLAARWPARAGALAARLNGLPKYVVSSTLADPAWSNATVLTGDAVETVAALKRRLAGEIVVLGSGRLARTLIEHDLADELRLLVHPVVLGAGERLFGATGEPKAMRLAGARPVAGGVTLLVYAFASSP
jgi:dihydrofolate reductase